MIEKIQKILCCPNGCVRLDDCWSHKGPGRLTRIEQTKAIVAELNRVVENCAQIADSYDCLEAVLIADQIRKSK